MMCLSIDDRQVTCGDVICSAVAAEERAELLQLSAAGGYHVESKLFAARGSAGDEIDEIAGHSELSVSDGSADVYEGCLMTRIFPLVGDTVIDKPGTTSGGLQAPLQPFLGTL